MDNKFENQEYSPEKGIGPAVVRQNKVAEQQYYDNLFRERKRFDQFQVEIYEHVAAEARRGTQGSVALDLGCGSGTQTLCLMDKGFQVVSADLSFEAAKISKSNTRHAKNIGLVVNADAESLPFSDASIDACVCSLFLHHFKNLDGVASELQRVMRPGGVVVATDANAHNPFAFLFFNVVHKMRPLSWLTPDQRALTCKEIEGSFGKFGFSQFQFDSFTTDLRRDWLGDSFVFTLNFYARALLLWVSRRTLPKLAQGNGLISVFKRLPVSAL